VPFKTIVALVVFCDLIATWAVAQPLVPTDNKAEADIFATGAMTAAGNADTVYAWDLKSNYPKKEWPLGASANHWFVFSPKLEFVANKGTNANPDRLSAAGNLEMWLFTSDVTGALLPNVVVANVLGAEFDRDRVTKAFAVQSLVRGVFRTFGPDQQLDTLGFVPWLEAGVETGKNFENKLQPDGSGTIGRFYAGVNAYQRLGRPWIAVTGIHQFRKPFHEEIFLRKSETGTDLRLSKDARHYTEIALIINVQKFLSIKPTYKRGTLPPAFNYLDNEFSLALQFGAKAQSTLKK